MIANKQKCADNDKSVCDYNEFSRLQYFHGMLLDENAFKEEQSYHNAKRRFLNRMLHGTGVVCGLELLGKPDGQSIEVSSGLALDCSGNEIWVPKKKPIDLGSLLPPKARDKNAGECEEPEPKKPNTYYVGIRYADRPSNPVSVYLPAGGCDERTCENSRVKEGYCVEIVPCCLDKPDPEKYPGLIKRLCGCKEDFEPGEKDFVFCPRCKDVTPAKKKCQCITMEQFCEHSVPCPECCSCEKPCFVVLGQIEVNEKGRLESICMNECRRYVLTPHLLQHILRGILVGATGEDGYLKMQVGDDKIPLPEEATEWIYNPMKALCWWLPYAAVDKGEIKFQGCSKGETDQQEGEVTVAQLEQEFRTLQAMGTQLNNKIELLKQRSVPASVSTAEVPAAVGAPAVTEAEAKDTATPDKPNGKQSAKNPKTK